MLDAYLLGAYEVVLRVLATYYYAVSRDAYAYVEPRCHFLCSAHTLCYYTTAFYESALSYSNSVEQCE